MKTWTNPEVEELEVEMTAGGLPLSWYENGYLPGPFNPPTPDTPDPEEQNPGTDEPGKDETTDGQS